MTFLGKEYKDGDIIVTQGERGECMYVIQEGEVEVFTTENGKEIRIATRGAGEFFGEMAIFEREVRSASVRALGPARVLTIDKKNLLKRIHEDPSLAFRLIESMSRRLRALTEEVSKLKKAP